MDNNQLKLLIECCTSFEEADHYISRYGNFETVKEKIDFLEANFDVEIFKELHDSSEEVDYCAMLTAVVRSKWQ